VAAEAINNAKSLEPAKIRDAIKNINMSSTPFGPIKFDNGQNQHPVLITQFKRDNIAWSSPPTPQKPSR